MEYVHASQAKRILALGVATLLTFMATNALAQQTHYTDVQSGAWYEEAAFELLRIGALDDAEVRLRPNDLATRAEVLKLLVDAYGEELVYPSTPSFSDVPRSAWYFPYVETAARVGWLRGDNNCYGTGIANCTARPAANVNRAEMAALLKRAYNLPFLRIAPVFPDVSSGEWYYDPIQTGADHCILQGDAGTGRVRPAANMNRAEMIVMMHRATMQMRHGQECGVARGEISNVDAISLNRLRLTFNGDMDPNSIGNEDRYMIERTTGSDLDITDIQVINARIVEITVDPSFLEDTNYRVSVENMITEGGESFDDSITFTTDEDLDDVDGQPEIESVTMRSSTMLRVVFSQDMNAARANDESRYTLARSTGGSNIDIEDVLIVNDFTVDLELESSLLSQATYRLSVNDLLTEDGDLFDDNFVFVSSTTASGSLSLQSVTPISATRLRLTFSDDLDELRSEESIRYRVFGSGGELRVTSAGLVDDNVVELLLADSLQSQQGYGIEATNLYTSGGTTFSTERSFIYSPSNVNFDAMLRGTNEIPSNPSIATGTGTFMLTSSGLQYDITLSGLSGSTLTGAHFHRGAPGVNGPVLRAITFTNNRAIGTWTDLTSSDRANLLDEDIYVNIHTNAYPDGEIRGQVEVN